MRTVVWHIAFRPRTLGAAGSRELILRIGRLSLALRLREKRWVWEYCWTWSEIAERMVLFLHESLHWLGFADRIEVGIDGPLERLLVQHIACRLRWERV
jgi:hypothetical protein